MAKPVKFFGQNTVIFPHPNDVDKVSPLPAHITPQGVLLSCWELSEEELEEVKNTGKVFLEMYGKIPPHSIRGKNPFINNNIKGN